MTATATVAPFRRQSCNRPPSVPWQPLTAWIPRHGSAAWRTLTLLADGPATGTALLARLPDVTPQQFHAATYRLRRHGYADRTGPKDGRATWTLTPTGGQVLTAGASDLTVRQAQVLLLLTPGRPAGLLSLVQAFGDRHGPRHCALVHHTRVHQLLIVLEGRNLVAHLSADRQWALTDLGAARQPLARARLGLT
ncbi:winged helix-turn-helix transcriptional regulator [Deinococcus sp. 6YEL10]|uniref:MarR family winged helix-turn-helix transcriptional regulator n=1 Tax=Deinococcus sp. 6YEL10 TaxID=2745870 RepID=UPI001E4735B9|nr:MarR family winged helix-turn-helix transcriptional regulator [Deinococcus sp. 6YEL10]MCD0159980.1 winged helix-turn-helix transcriptional regulator [Deinococcus sp. 6YEL10]